MIFTHSESLKQLLQLYYNFFKILVRPVHLLQDSGNNFTNNLEHLQQFDVNGIIVHPYKLLIILHDFYTLRKRLIAILALLQFFKIPVRPVHVLQDSGIKFISSLEHLQQFDANDILFHHYKILIIVHDCYTLRKPSIGIIALLQFLKFR